MFGWLRKEDEVAGFWRWFTKNAGRIRAGVDRLDHGVIVHDLGRRIAKAAPGVVHEIGKPDDRTVELILSADGVRSGIPGVLTLMAAAPKLEGFLFTAFRPRRSDLNLQISGWTVDADAVRYLSQPEADVLHLRLFVASDRSERERGAIGFLLLDQALGEYDVMTGVGHIDFPAGDAPAEAKPLSALAAEFDAVRGAARH